jgi:hypothetical protein
MEALLRLPPVTFLIAVICLLQLAPKSLSQPIVPTWWSVNPCDYLPEFYLSDVNPQSPTNNGREYGLYYTNITDLIIVGLYLADVPVSIENAKRQEELGNELVSMGYTVKNVILNYYAPLSCALDGECVNPWGFWSYDTCRGYVAGCPPGDSRLSFEKWQQPLTDAVTLPVFQDVPTQMVWDWFGGLSSDPSAWDCPNPLIGGGLRNQTSYELARAAAVAAAHSDIDDRCRAYDIKNDYYNAVAEYSARQHMIYYVDDWYYYNDFGWNDDNPSGNGHFISVARRHTSHTIQHKLPPKYIYASLFALVFVAITATLLYRRWKRNQSMSFLDGTVRFTQLSTEDDDAVLQNAEIGAAAESTAIAVIGVPTEGTENRYGSL